MTSFLVKQFRFVVNSERKNLECELVCKLLGTKTFNFIVVVNFFKLVKIPISFLFQHEHNEHGDKLLDQLLSYPIRRVCKMSADTTNHQLVFFHEYAMYTYAQRKLMFDLHEKYDCCFDFNFSKDFEVFLVQNNINIGLNVFPTNCLPKLESFKCRAGCEFFVVENLSTATTSFEYESDCLALWFNHQDNIKPVYSIGTFDIETGLRGNNQTSKQLPFPTPINGYVQCIVLHLTTMVDSLNEDANKLFSWVYKPPTIYVDESQINKKLLKRFNIPATCVRVFTNEFSLIDNFLLFVNNNVDVLVGFNSKDFDLNFLIVRHNILKNPHNWFLKPQLVYLTDYSSKHKLTMQPAKTIQIVTKCPSCDASVYVNKANIYYRSSSEGRLVKLEKGPITTSDTMMYVTMCPCQESIPILNVSIEKKSELFSKIEMPFTYHQDLLLDKRILDEDLTNRKLESICNSQFKQRVESIVKNESTGLYGIMLYKRFDRSDLFVVGNCFFVGVKIILCSIERNSNQLTPLKGGRIESVELCGGKVGTLDFNYKNMSKCVALCPVNGVSLCLYVSCENDDLLHSSQEILDKGGYLYCTVGKTSDQTLEQQLLWKTSENIVDTVTYCVVDVLLTVALERKVKTLFDILHANFLQQTPFSAMCSSAGNKSNNLLVSGMYNNTILSRSNHLGSQIHLDTSLSVEGVPVSGVSSSDHIYKVSSLQTLNQYLFVNCGTNNSNEFDFSICGEYDPCDFETTKEKLNELLHYV